VEHPFLALERPGTVRAIAHRGGGGEVENTLAAFADAVALGYRHLETDLHVTRDGVLVVAHDPTLARVAGDPRPIAELTADELARVRVGGREPMPTFAELVTAFPDARLTVDLKCDAAVAPMVRFLEGRPELLDRLCLGSFSTARVAEMRRRFGPRLMTAATPREVLRLLVAVRLGRRPPAIAAGCVAVPERYPAADPGTGRGRGAGVAVADARLADAAAEGGFALHVWTVNDPGRMRALATEGAGVAGIVTDELRLLRDTLVTAGRW
jgi:glycerophosphoryl diester phosphodiesterase